MPSDQRNQKFYSEDSSAYDSRWVTKGGGYTNSEQLRIVRNLCSAWAGRRVLEVGCGTGRFSEILAAQGCRLTIVDISPQMIDETNRRLSRGGLFSHLEDKSAGSIYSLPYDDEAFDCVVSLNVFNHLADLETAFHECARVLKKDGLMLLNYANLLSLYLPAGIVVNLRKAALGQGVYSHWNIPHHLQACARSEGLVVDRCLGHVHIPRVAEKLMPVGLVAAIDRALREGYLTAFAPVHFVLCHKV